MGGKAREASEQIPKGSTTRTRSVSNHPQYNQDPFSGGIERILGNLRQFSELIETSRLPLQPPDWIYPRFFDGRRNAIDPSRVAHDLGLIPLASCPAGVPPRIERAFSGWIRLINMRFTQLRRTHDSSAARPASVA